MQESRSCDGSTGEEFHFNGQTFKQCPRMWAIQNLNYIKAIDLYLDCCGGKALESSGFAASIAPMIHLPFAGRVMEQPAVIMDAFRVIRGELAAMASEINTSRKDQE